MQALFSKLQQLAIIAGDVLLGKEKLQKILLARLTETVIIWLSNEQEFWSAFEDESNPLQPSGLQQVETLSFTTLIYLSYSLISGSAVKDWKFEMGNNWNLMLKFISWEDWGWKLKFCCHVLQLILDMNFTVEIARFAGYPFKVVQNHASVVINRAINIFSERGINPQR